MAKPTVTRYRLAKINADGIRFVPNNKDGDFSPSRVKHWAKIGQVKYKGNATYWREDGGNLIKTQDLIDLINTKMAEYDKSKKPYIVSIEDYLIEDVIYLSNWVFNKEKSRAIIKPRFEVRKFIWSNWKGF